MRSDDFPAWFYNPETREGRIFETADAVPDGWVTGLDGIEAASGDETKPMTRKELVDALTNGGIAFDKRATVADLDALLREKATEALVKRGLSADELKAEDTRALLARIGG